MVEGEGFTLGQRVPVERLVGLCSVVVLMVMGRDGLGVVLPELLWETVE
jgi:hypothetical protein